MYRPASAPDTDHTISRHAANPGAALRADQSDIDASAIGGALKLTWLKPRQGEPLLGDDDPQGKRTAGQALAIQAVAGIDRLRLFADLIANLPALATAALWELHGPLPITQHADNRRLSLGHFAQNYVSVLVSLGPKLAVRRHPGKCPAADGRLLHLALGRDGEPIALAPVFGGAGAEIRVSRRRACSSRLR